MHEFIYLFNGLHHIKHNMTWHRVTKATKRQKIIFNKQYTMNGTGHVVCWLWKRKKSLSYPISPTALIGIAYCYN